MGIEFEFFRVLPILLFFIAIAYAVTEKSKAWGIMVAGLMLNGLLWLIISLLVSKYYPALAKRPNKSQCYFWYQKNIDVDNGMPSGHCQSAAFFSTWLILMAIYYKLDPVILLLVICIALFITIGMIYSRVVNYKCHTILQASVGTSIGFGTALLLRIFYM